MSDEHEVRRYIEAYRETTADKARLVALGARIGDAAFAGGLSPTAAKPKLAVVTKVLGGLLLVVGAASLLASSGPAVSTSSGSEPARAAVALPSLAQPEVASPERSAAAPPEVPETAVVETQTPIATVTATRIEPSQPSRARAAKPRKATPPKQVALETSDEDLLAAELRLIKAARRQLETNVGGALESLRQHEARFGSDAVFAAERLALLAVAQCRDGRIDDGQATIARLRRLFPGHAGTRRAVRNCRVAEPSDLSELK